MEPIIDHSIGRAGEEAVKSRASRRFDSIIRGLAQEPPDPLHVNVRRRLIADGDA